MSRAPRLIPKGLEATLVLVRHGETDYIVEGRFQGQAPVALTAIGRRQATLAGEHLAARERSPALPVPAGQPLEIAYSPLPRTAESAAIIATAFESAGVAVPTRPDDGFREIGQGVWEGRLLAEIEAQWREVLAGWRRDPVRWTAPGGESLPEVSHRVQEALTVLLERLADVAPRTSLDRPQVVGYRRGPATLEQPWSIVVAHDGVFKIVLLTLFGLPLDAFWSFPFALGGISVVEIRAGRAGLRAHNLTDHLAPLLDELAQAESEARERSGAL